MAAELRIHMLSALVVLGTFIGGAVAGAGLYRLWQPRQVLHAPAVLPFFHELSLSAEQTKQAEEIVAKYRPELERIMHGSFEQVRAVQDRINAEVRAILTPEQRKLFDERQQLPAPPGMHLVPGSRPPSGFAPLSPSPGMVPLPPPSGTEPSPAPKSIPMAPGTPTDAG